MFRILVINPGSTSTKIAVYEDEAPLFVESRDHDTAKLSPAVMEQFELRHRLLLDVLTEKGINPASRGRSASRRSSMIPSPWTKWIPSPASPGFRP